MPIIVFVTSLFARNLDRARVSEIIRWFIRAKVTEVSSSLIALDVFKIDSLAKAPVGAPAGSLLSSGMQFLHSHTNGCG